MNLTKTQANKAAAAIHDILAKYTKLDADFSAAHGFAPSDPFADSSIIQKANAVIVSYDGYAYDLLSMRSEVSGYHRAEVITALDKLGMWIEDINATSFEVLPR